MNTPAKAEPLLRRLKQTAGSISLHEKENKTEYMCFIHERALSTLKFVDKSTYHDSNILSTESNGIYLTRRKLLSIGYRSFERLIYPIKQNGIFPSCGCIRSVIWMHLIEREKKLDRNYARMLRDSLKKSWKQPPHKTVLCFDLLTRPKMPFKVMHRKEVTHSSGSYKRKSRGRELADEMGRGKKNPIILS